MAQNGLVSEFERYGVRYGGGEVGFGILLDFVGVWEIENKVEFLSWCVDESAIGSAVFPVLLISFNYPQLVENNV